MAAAATLPFRVPIASGGSTANLLVPLYLVVAAGAVAYAVPRLAGPRAPGGRARPGRARVVARRRARALRGSRSAYSDDFGHALENVVFFYVPFALLFVLVARVEWTPRLARVCLGVLVVLALALVGVGFVEYATRHLFLNPKVIASNQLEDYFRVNSLFFDPNIYGRFLAIVMLLVAAWLLWARRQRDVVVGAAAARRAVGRARADLLAVELRRPARRPRGPRGACAGACAGRSSCRAPRWSSAVGFVALAPGAVHLELGNSKSADKATSGRYDLIKGGLKLFDDAPLVGQGSGSFAREYRRAEHVSPERAASASHTIPVTVAAEQGAARPRRLPGAAGGRAVRGCSAALGGVPERAAVAAAFVALIAHTMMYAAFLEDPLTWTLLGAGTAMALWAAVREPAPA